MNGLTEKQTKVLMYIIRFRDSHGFPPTIREIGDALNLKSLRGVTVHLDALEKKHYIERWPFARAIKVLREPKV